MKAIKATANEKNKTYKIVKTWRDGTSVTYKTTELTNQEFKDFQYNTENDWKNFLDTSQSYYKVK